MVAEGVRAERGGDEERARHALDLVYRDPAAASEAARALQRSRSPVARAIAALTLGRVHHEQGHLPQARRAIRQALEICRRHGEQALEGTILGNLAMVLVESGRTAEALATLDQAEPIVGEADRGRLLQHRAVVTYHLGDWPGAIEACERALPLIRQVGDLASEARLELVHGTSLLCAGRFEDATRHLSAARALGEGSGERLVAALAVHNLGCVEARQGRLPAALATFEQARAAYRELADDGRLAIILDADQAEALLIAGLSGEAAEVAGRSAEAAHRTGNLVNEAEARLMQARALLAEGRPEPAGEAAAAAAGLFRRSRRQGWATYAAYLGLQAEVAAAGDAPARAVWLRRADRLARQLTDRGWRTEAMQVRAYLARLALARGDQASARAQLELLAGGRRLRNVTEQVTVDYARALMAAGDGRTAAALGPLRRGLAALDRHRAVMGATELRVGAGAHGAELARLGLAVALSSGRPSLVFEWSERSRAGALRLLPPRMPHDPELADAFSQWRRLKAERVAATADGARSDLVGQQLVEVERVISARSRLVASEPTDPITIPSLREIRAALGDRVMLAFWEHEGRLGLQRIDRGGTARFDLGPAGPVMEETTLVMSALRRIAFSAGTERSATSHRQLDAAAGRLEELLLGPSSGLNLRRSRTSEVAGLVPGDPGVVVVPCAALSEVPFGVLPSLRHRELAVCPSAALWHRLGDPGPGPGVADRVTLVAGPDLRAAGPEVEALARVHPGARRLQGGQATVGAVSLALEESELVHVAAHGDFRRDNPLFSALRLADGPLTIYDMERLRRVPSRIVLSSCSLANNRVTAGGELIGAAVALVHLGCRSVIAPLSPVEDATTARIMVDLHRRLASGQGMAEALAGVRGAGRDDGDVRLLATACLFACLGR